MVIDALMAVGAWALSNPLEFLVGDTLFTWVFYVVMCSIKRAYDADRIPKLLLPFAWIALGFFMVADAMFNAVPGTVFFWQWPTTLLFTERCKQNKLRSDWRAVEARWWCSKALNPFDPSGVHC